MSNDLHPTLIEEGKGSANGIQRTRLLVNVDDPADFGKFAPGDMFIDEDPEFLKRITVLFNSGANLGRNLLLAVFLPLAVLVSPMIGMFTAMADYLRLWLRPFYSIFRTIGSLVEHIIEIALARRAINDLARYQTAIMKAKVDAGLLPDGVPLAIAA